jgi:hypothetical protein
MTVAWTTLSSFALSLALGTSGCRSLDRFDTGDDHAYCGTIVDAQFVRTTVQEGGFDRTLRMRLTLDVDAFTTVPGAITTDDGEEGPCAPSPTFSAAPLLATPEVHHDVLSTFSLGESRPDNLVTWVESTCRGPMLAVISLMTSDDVEVRLLKPPALGQDVARPAFGLFELSRRRGDCGF